MRVKCLFVHNFNNGAFYPGSADSLGKLPKASNVYAIADTVFNRTILAEHALFAEHIYKTVASMIDSNNRVDVHKLITLARFQGKEHAAIID